MAQHNELGRLGEQQACRYLAEKGYSLLARNWRLGHLEIDIIADYFGEVVFVEVKTRSSEAIAEAVKAVDHEKRANLIDAAAYYMGQNKLDRPFRFDIITLVGHRPPFEIKHYVNAFTPEGVRNNAETPHLR